MSKLKIVVIALVGLFVLGWVGYGAYLGLSSDKKNPDISTNVDTKKNQSDKASQNYVLPNDQLKFEYGSSTSIANFGESNTEEGSTIPKGDSVDIESGKLTMSIFTSLQGIGGLDSCEIEDTKCEILATRDLKVFGKPMKMTYWKETFKNEDGSTSENNAAYIGEKGSKEDRSLYTYMFKSQNIKDAGGEAVNNAISISKKDDPATENFESITLDDFNSQDMTNLIKVIESIRY